MKPDTRVELVLEHQQRPSLDKPGGIHIRPIRLYTLFLRHLDLAFIDVPPRPCDARGRPTDRQISPSQDRSLASCSVLLRQGKVDEAEQAFRDSLARVRNNGWALAGLVQVYRLKGDTKAERTARRAYERAWFGPRSGPDLQRL